MLRILDRYFLRELAMAVLAATVVLLVIFTGGTFARVLQQVANGSFPAGVMFQVLGLRIVAALPGLMPLALFLGVLIALGRLWRDSEMHVLASSGMGARGLLRPALLLGVPAAIVIGSLSLWLGPWSVRTADALIAEANRSVIAAGLEAGRFTELQGGAGVIFTDSISRDGSRLGRTFIASERPAADGKPAKLRIVTARSGQLYQENDGQSRFLALLDGWQYQVPLGHDNWQRMRYARNDKSLSDVQPDPDDADDPVASAGTLQLARADDPPSRAELAWRMAAPMTALVLVLLALPLARQSPREARYGRLLIAVLAYFLYFLLMSLGRALIERGNAGPGPMWAVHLLVGGTALWFFRRQYRPWRTRGADA